MQRSFSRSGLAKGRVERLGNRDHIVIIDDNHGNHHELAAMDPWDAHRVATDLCERLGLALTSWHIPSAVVKAHYDDALSFLSTPTAEE
jgi:hypothetical protein